MAWYYGTFSCGHDGRVNIIGPTKDRQWKADNQFSKLCPDCYWKYLEKEKERKNKEAAERAKEMELPELTGSEKQIAWANTLRNKLIENLTHLAEDEMGIRKIREYYDLKVTGEDLIKIRDYIITNITSAKYFINNRDEHIAYTIDREMKKALKTEEELIKEMQEKDIKEESTVYPENRITDIPVDIVTKDDTIKAYFERNEKFRSLIKSLGYKWSGEAWERYIDYMNGSIEDRVAELGNKLLNEGFPIIILDEKTREKAINGEYEQECKRWISHKIAGNYKGWLIINWNGRDDILYKNARRLPGSRWDKGVVVRVEHIDEVEDFANLYDFKFSKGAIEAIKEYREKINKAEVVKPKEAVEKEEKDGLKEILESSTDVLDDLIDD